mmetsp:Transcript_22655/g.49498  ORF Transcript_22655/g.49498 Transcript_22655/m.49498 type:complete len:654 (+) Transcript_22655:195-2156(+)
MAYLDPAVEYVKPLEQLDLSEKELKEELTKVLRADNPAAPHNIVRFSNKDKVYRLEASVDQTISHYALEGTLLHLKSDEAMKQKDMQDEAKDQLAKDAEKRKAEGNDDDEDARGLRNQFNFTERNSQTLNGAIKEKDTMTEPPPSVEYAAQATQWEIFDDYMADQERKRELAEKTAKGKTAAPVAKPKEGKGGDSGEAKDANMGRAAKILERMVNLNTYEDIAQDFKFWEDASDQFREGEGTLLPLWKFYNERVKGKHVTAVRWNPKHPDLFAVGYGSYDFMKQGSGMLCLYSLKNPSHPESVWSTLSGVMCLDWHPTEDALLCVGLYDGSVCVFETRPEVPNPIYQSKAAAGKHTDPVWEVSWQEEGLVKDLSFFSISSDGRVTFWILSKSELEHSDRIRLQLIAAPGEGDLDGSNLFGLAGGCCFDFSPHSSHLFLVGTEEGKIHKCSKAYNADYLETYEGHSMAVYTVRWSHFNESVFLSCSADWTIKMWDHERQQPLFSFDLDNQVGDVAWAPWSSTTFAACTADGKVHVYDLNENPHEPLCEQKVVRKAKLTKITFNTKGLEAPVILVGDDHSCVSSLKLSPNLRWTAVTKAEADARAKAEAEAAASSGPRRGAPKPIQGEGDEQQKPPREQEIEKLEKIIANVLKSP